MNNKVQFESQIALRQIWIKVSVVLLLIFVAGLSTLAKNGQYFPTTTPAHYVSISTKMNVTHAPVIVVGDHLEPIARISQLVTVIRRTSLEQLTIAPIPPIGVTLSMQHRSPPLQLA